MCLKLKLLFKKNLISSSWFLGSVAACLLVTRGENPGRGPAESFSHESSGLRAGNTDTSLVIDLHHTEQTHG